METVSVILRKTAETRDPDTKKKSGIKVLRKTDCRPSGSESTTEATRTGKKDVGRRYGYNFSPPQKDSKETAKTQQSGNKTEV